MRPMCKDNIWRIWVRIKDNQVVPSRNTTVMPLRREKQGGKEITRRPKPLHISEKIQPITITIIILMVTHEISVGIYI
jgi:hypothetical protein